MGFDPITYALSKGYAESAKQEALEKTNWRYIGKITTAEDVTNITFQNDENGNPFRFKKIMLQGMIAPNSAGNDGYIRLGINDQWTGGKIAFAVPASSNNTGYTFRVAVEVLAGRAMTTLMIRGFNQSSMKQYLVYNTGEQEDINAVIKADAIIKIVCGGWQSNAVGAGSYIELWGVDA